jgi:hypothetical protein
MSESPANPMPILFEALVKNRCVTATWNRDKVVLAPHIIYTRHGDVFVDAITVARNNMLPRETKFGTYKVAGLGDLKLSARQFEVSGLFEPEAEKYAGVTLMKVEPLSEDAAAA